jgi:Condensation domain/Phosphopantetheine attachment site
VDLMPLEPRETAQQIGPATRAQEPAEPPETETELLLAPIWAAALDRNCIGRHDNFFALGGDSLSVVVVEAHVQTVWAVDLDPRALTDHPTLAQLAARIDDLRRSVAGECSPQLARVSRAAPLPLSYAQERIWRYSQTPEGLAGWTNIGHNRIRGPLDVEAFRAGINYLVRRHEILRTTFATVGGRPVQEVRPPITVPVPLLDLAQAANAEEQATAFFRDAARQPFDLARLPLLRFWLVRVGQDEHRLLYTCHHIIDDRWSWDIFFKELRLLYEARLRGEDPPLPEWEPLQYVDYAAWQRRALRPGELAYQNAIAWWRDQFAGTPRPLELPCRRPQPLADISPDEGLIWWRHDSDTSKRLNRLGHEIGATYYAVRLAAFVALLAAETGQPDVVLGTYFTNRNNVEVQKMFGFFANLATLRLCCAQTCTFRQWVSAVGNKVSDARARCELPYEQLCEELRQQGVNPPEIRVIFGVTHHTAPVRLGSAEITWQERQQGSMPWGFSLRFNQHREDRCSVSCDARLYEPKGVRALLERFCCFLDAASRNPDLQLDELLGMTTTLPQSQHDRVA